MGRFLLMLGACLVFAGTAAAAQRTVVGSGTAAWGDPFTLSVSIQKVAGRTMRCLGEEGPDGGGSGCPLVRPRVDAVDVGASVDCERKQVLLYGALDARVARVVVRLVGGKTIEGLRFAPVAAIDPRMAYWAASFAGTTAVRSVTTVAADGTVLARERSAPSSSCAEEREFTGRRYHIGLVTDGDGKTWRVDAYRGLVHDDDAGLVRTLCFSLKQVGTGEPLTNGGSSSCGIELSREAKALALSSDTLGCQAGVNQILYGVARPKVARIVFRSRAGWTVAVPTVAPHGLKVRGRLWVVGIHVPKTGYVIDAQDRFGRTIVKRRIKPYKIPGIPGCPASSGFGEL